MRPTLAFVFERFDYFNRLIFKPELPPIPIRIGSGRRALGSFRYPRNFPAGKERGKGECSITISGVYDRPVNEIEDVIIHEMIHYFVWLNRVEECAHGPEFRRVMEHINRRLNRNITITEHLDEDTRRTDARKKPHFIVSTTLMDGQRAFAVVAKSAASTIRRTLESNGLNLKWWLSFDPFFNRFPTVRTAKLFHISEEDFERYIESAYPVK